MWTSSLQEDSNVTNRCYWTEQGRKPFPPPAVQFLCRYIQQLYIHVRILWYKQGLWPFIAYKITLSISDAVLCYRWASHLAGYSSTLISFPPFHDVPRYSPYLRDCNPTAKAAFSSIADPKRVWVYCIGLVFVCSHSHYLSVLERRDVFLGEKRSDSSAYVRIFVNKH